MIHTFLMELTDDASGYSEEVERLERIYGIEEFNLAEHDAEIKSEVIEDVIIYVLNAYKYDVISRGQLKIILNEAKEVFR